MTSMKKKMKTKNYFLVYWEAGEYVGIFEDDKEKDYPQVSNNPLTFLADAIKIQSQSDETKGYTSTFQVIKYNELQKMRKYPKPTLEQHLFIMQNGGYNYD